MALSERDKGAYPAPGSGSEHEAFARLQARLAPLFRDVFPDPRAARTVLIVPSLSLDQEVMARISGVPHYEERLLCLLLLLRLPRTRVVYVSSEPIPDAVIDYYLHLLTGIPAGHARRRLTLLACHDGSARSLSDKILERPRLLERILAAIPDRATAHMTCFNVTAAERSLAVRLGLPIYGCDPRLLHLGSKSGSRRLFREAGVAVPEGFEDLADVADLAEALTRLKAGAPDLRRAVVKLNEGFSGEGNAVFSYAGAPRGGADLERWVRARLAGMAYETDAMTWESFAAKVGEMGAVVEAFIEGEVTRSPSAQFRIDPLGELDVISTHDQVLGGAASQIFLGCRFPADARYRLEVQREGLEAARRLREAGVVGRFGIDFMSVHTGQGWQHYAIEVNLRKGGTTHPFLMLQFLTDGRYDPDTGQFHAPNGQPCCYYASDNIEASRYRGLTPDDLIDIAVLNDLHFHGATQQGVVFHLIGALSRFGKLGMVCVADDAAGAERLYRQTMTVLDRESGAARG